MFFAGLAFANVFTFFEPFAPLAFFAAFWLFFGDAKPSEPWRQSMYYHFYEREPEHNAAPHFGVRTLTHKLIHFYTHDEWELYDLTTDPHELKNVYNNPAYAVKRNELKAELERLRKEFGDS